MLAVRGLSDGHRDGDAVPWTFIGVGRVPVRVHGLGARLTLADEERARTFHRLRRRENAEPDFTWPAVAHTLSESDLRPPAGPTPAA